MAKIIDLTGRVFGMLTVTSIGDRKPNGRITWRCKCECGTVKDITPADLVHGGTASCGCLRNEASAKTAKKLKKIDANRRHPMYSRWRSMIQRCENRRSPYFKNYGGRGVFVCERWRKSFRQFLADMGEPPQGYTLDRIDNDGPYSPENCRWASQAVQHKNNRRAVLITVGGVTMQPKEWADFLGINWQRITRAHRIGGAESAIRLIKSLGS